MVFQFVIVENRYGHETQAYDGERAERNIEQPQHVFLFIFHVLVPNVVEIVLVAKLLHLRHVHACIELRVYSPFRKVVNLLFLLQYLYLSDDTSSLSCTCNTSA